MFSVLLACGIRENMNMLYNSLCQTIRAEMGVPSKIKSSHTRVAAGCSDDLCQRIELNREGMAAS